MAFDETLPPPQVRRCTPLLYSSLVHLVFDLELDGIPVG